MEGTDIAATAAVEERHWWYRERRSIIARQVRRLGTPGRAVEIGAAGGGNSLVLRRLGWQVLATEYLPEGVAIARDRGLDAVRADARSLPVASGSMDLALAFDVLEHIDEDDLAAAELHRVLRPGGTLLVAVPCDMALWSAHDVASGHVRRYTRAGLAGLVARAGFAVEALWSWNVLLRPAVALARRRASGCSVTKVNPLANALFGGVIAAERLLPLGGLPGVSLMLRARRPDR